MKTQTNSNSITWLASAVVLAVVIGHAPRTEAAWHLVWADDFNGTSLSDAEWEYEVGGGGWGNGELEFYTCKREQNVRVTGGNLIIEARPENLRDHHFTSGRLMSKKGFTYGRFEARARLPSGHNLWPAIWMYPKEEKYGGWANSGEIDIMEYRGDKPNEIQGSIHYGGGWPNNIYSGSAEKRFAQVADFSKDYHIFAFEWEQNELRWFMDGNKYHTENINRMMWSGKGSNPYTKNGQPFDQPFHWVLNLAIGGQFFGGGPYVSPQEAQSWPKRTFEIDYLHVYEWKP